MEVEYNGNAKNNAEAYAKYFADELQKKQGISVKDFGIIRIEINQSVRINLSKSFPVLDEIIT